MLVPETEADLLRRRRLRQMQAAATGLLVFAAVVFFATRHLDGWWGYVNAGAEASMVGAMADWFAVTALFRHPLGLPIPHTALIPRRKDDFGESLETFFAENFLQEQVIRDRLAVANVTGRVGAWVCEPANARRVVNEAAAVAVIGLGKLKDDDVADVVREVIIPRFLDEPVAPLAGRFLAEVVADGAHHSLVDLALEEASRWLRRNEETFTSVLSERAPWWAPPRVNEVVTQRVYVEAIRWVEDIRSNPQHQARQALDSLLAQLAEDLLEDPETAQRAERLKERILTHPEVVNTGLSLWAALKHALLATLEDEASPVRARAEAELMAFGSRVVEDAELRGRIEEWLADLAVWGIERYGDELTTVITHTIKQWDGREAARKIELHVGRDLQYIRINGTIVGGLVGVTIHAIVQLVG
ncbi:MAG TPA: DUF445 domain-containing protein [Marmoricola sp.]|nr:DUF445 domain-containing protein [Marmoricola sp.]HNN47893.1 DUF445 domain-containing protein [Marmoricola sp.]